MIINIFEIFYFVQIGLHPLDHFCLSLFKREKSYELVIGKNFISFFEKFIYNNTYIYNLLNYFLRHIYPHPTLETNTNNINILFNYYLRANSNFYTMYIDISSHLISQKLHIYFQKKDAVVVFIDSIPHKSVGMMKK